MEEWRPVPEWEDLYEVSSWGRIKSLDRLVKVPGRLSYIRPERIMSLNPDKHGYLYCDLTRDSKKCRVFVHIIVARAWHGPNPEGCGSLHKNGDNQHNAPDNLYWGTQADNYRDTVRHGKSGLRRGRDAAA
ncbi:NUMOD4 domain-containing protein [Mycobacterium paragordonae]|uniref:NUMOD4 domain-containing protein n=1 Tax=Mycobacterium paragordonae TaxID=1389713 RepID=UPI00351B015E